SGPQKVVFANPSQAVTTATFTDPGFYTLQLAASDGKAISTAVATVTVNAPAGAPPTVSLAAPADGATLTGATDVVGSVSGGFWRLAYRQGGPTSSNPVIEFATGIGAVNNAKLGTF